MRLKRPLVLLLSALVALGAAAGQSMAAAEAATTQTIYRAGSQALIKGSSEYFTGTVSGRNVQWLENVSDEQYNDNRRVEHMSPDHALTARQQAIIPIAAFTANGDVEKLRTALHEGLSAGLTVNEIKEILVQMYAYAGFPRSLNGINAFMSVMDERQAKGIKDEVGKAAASLPPDLNRSQFGAEVRAKLLRQEVIPPPSGYQLFLPVIDDFLKEHLFADIFARDVLDFQDRELATISALAGMTGTAAQLKSHLGIAMNTGLTETQMRGFISVMQSKVGRNQVDSANELLETILSSRRGE